MLSVVSDGPTRGNSPSILDEIVREGARRMLAAALEEFFGGSAGLSSSVSCG